jgi:hypothetical protein
MDTTESQALPAPPNLIKVLLAGFDAISNHLALLIFPLAFDLLLWFGPRLRLKQLVEAIFQQAALLPEVNTPEMAEMMRSSRELWFHLAEQFNLFSLLRTFPIGIPSLMAGRFPSENPLGSAQVVEVASFAGFLGLWLLLGLAGLALGALYFSAVARVSLERDLSWNALLKDWPRIAGQVMMLTLVWILLALAVGLPFSCLFTVLMVMGLQVQQFSVLLFGVVLVWLLLPLVFSPHGIFVYRQRIFESVKTGARLIRLTLPSTGMFLLMLLVLGVGLDSLWEIPAESSWLSMVGVAGHAFISTALLSASFIYYRDANAWIQGMMQQIRMKVA